MLKSIEIKSRINILTEMVFKNIIKEITKLIHEN